MNADGGSFLSAFICVYLGRLFLASRRDKLSYDAATPHPNLRTGAGRVGGGCAVLDCHLRDSAGCRAGRLLRGVPRETEAALRTARHLDPAGALHALDGALHGVGAARDAACAANQEVVRAGHLAGGLSRLWTRRLVPRPYEINSMDGARYRGDGVSLLGDRDCAVRAGGLALARQEPGFLRQLSTRPHRRLQRARPMDGLQRPDDAGVDAGGRLADQQTRRPQPLGGRRGVDTGDGDWSGAVALVHAWRVAGLRHRCGLFIVALQARLDSAAAVAGRADIFRCAGLSSGAGPLDPRESRRLLNASATGDVSGRLV